jgi:hypothetical protein
MKLLLFNIAFLFVIGANPVTGQTPPATSQATQLFIQSRAEYKKASELEQSGKTEKALASYEQSARLGDASWLAAERSDLPPEQRPPSVYYYPAMAHLDAARLLVKMRGNLQRMDEHCQDCILDLGRAAMIETSLAGKTGNGLNPNVWKINNAAAYALFLRGDLARAREEIPARAHEKSYLPASERRHRAN